jgi:ABC-type microcin C transport system permease subunit YejE
MFNKKIIKKEVSVLHFLLLTTSKVLIGIGIGLIIATYFWFAQPYWYLLILIGAAILIPTLYNLMKAEEKEEITLEKKLKKQRK